MATFQEHLLVTRLGVKMKVNRNIGDSYTLCLGILHGDNPFTKRFHSRTKGLEYVKTPPCTNK